MSKIKDKNRILKATKEKLTVSHKRNTQKVINWFFQQKQHKKKNYIHTKNKDKGTWKKAIKQQGDAAKEEERNRGRLQNQPEKI